MLKATSTIAEINAALADGSATLDLARAILTARKDRDSSSGRRAAEWLKWADLGAANAITTPEPEPKAEPKKVNYRTEYAYAKVARTGIAHGAPGWRKAFFDAYTSAGAHKYEASKLSKLQLV